MKTKNVEIGDTRMAWAVAVTKQDGQSAHDYFYAPFGGIIDDNGHPEDSSNWTDPHNHYLLTGKEWDEESRLYYFGARYYDAAVGVWLTQDVYRGQVEQPLTLHRTLYVLANPVNHVDHVDTVPEDSKEASDNEYIEGQQTEYRQDFACFVDFSGNGKHCTLQFNDHAYTHDGSIYAPGAGLLFGAGWH